MDEDLGSNYITIEDEEGNEFELEELATIEFNDEQYAAFLPADMEESDPDFGYIILKLSEENGEIYYNTVDDDDELEAVYDRFMQLLFSEDDESGEE